jgi:hypothetical protein
MGSMNKNAGQAIIEKGQIVIRVPIKNLQVILDGACAINKYPLMKITDKEKFAKDLVQALNDEDEEGTTRIHKCFDKAFQEAIEQGSEWAEEIKEE